jgi:hypothetical protein
LHVVAIEKLEVNALDIQSVLPRRLGQQPIGSLPAKPNSEVVSGEALEKPIPCLLTAVGDFGDAQVRRKPVSEWTEIGGLFTRGRHDPRVLQNAAIELQALLQLGTQLAEASSVRPDPINGSKRIAAPGKCDIELILHAIESSEVARQRSDGPEEKNYREEHDIPPRRELDDGHDYSCLPQEQGNDQDNQSHGDGEDQCHPHPSNEGVPQPSSRADEVALLPMSKASDLFLVCIDALQFGINVGDELDRK